MFNKENNMTGKQVLKWIVDKGDERMAQLVLNGSFIECENQEGTYRDGQLELNGRMVDFNPSEITNITIKGQAPSAPKNPVLVTEETLKPEPIQGTGFSNQETGALDQDTGFLDPDPDQDTGAL